jgi:hypothetical protein
METAMSFRSDAHLLLGSEPTPPQVTAWQHPDYPDSFTVALDTHDRRAAGLADALIEAADLADATTPTRRLQPARAGRLATPTH